MGFSVRPTRPPRVTFKKRFPREQGQGRKMVALSRLKNNDESADEEFVHDMDLSALHIAAMIPDIFTTFPLITDSLKTQTSQVQLETVEECLPFLAAKVERGLTYGEHGVARLRRSHHVTFLRKTLEHKMPPQYTAVDPSRPWFLYWCLSGLAVLGADVTSYQERLVETARWMQNRDGGFAGGFGQMSHLATTYATILALATVGGEGVYDVIDRLALWKWLSSLKQPGGGFAMAVGGEVDVRGAYCAAVVISLLKLPLEIAPESAGSLPEDFNLYTGLAKYVQRCQTFEGGISGKPDGEAHGAYAFCALGCLSILDAPYEIVPKYLDVPRLMSWLSSRQYGPEGGFSGRTNKLVDGCYSHWIGACWPLVEACLGGPTNKTSGLVAANNSVYSREGLLRYTFNCCQETSKRGGLRDKPSRPSDAYHTCYVLAGISSAQYSYTFTPKQEKDCWSVSPHLVDKQIFNEEDYVGALHPLYVISQDKVAAVQDYFAARVGF